MNFYKRQHKFYGGIDLDARKMYVCILYQKGKVKVHKNIQFDGELFFELIFPYLEDVIVGVECIFCWYQASARATPQQAGSPICAPNTKSRLYQATHYTLRPPCG